MDSLDNIEVPVQPSSEVSNVVTQPEQPVEVTGSRSKAKTLAVVIIVVVCLSFLGGGLFFFRRSETKRIVGTNLSSSKSGASNGVEVNKKDCQEVWKLIEDNEELLKAFPKADPGRKIVFSSKDSVAPQFPQIHFPVFPGLKLCYSTAVETPDEQDLGTSTLSSVYYVASSVAEVSKWYEENIVKSDLELKPISRNNPVKQVSLNDPVLQTLFAKGDRDSYDFYYWEKGCCSPGQPSDSFAWIDVSRDETFPVVVFMYNIDVFKYKK